MDDNYYALIMAGGGGTRLWPVSRQTRPKQMIRFFGDATMFQMSVRRLFGLFPAERILVVTVPGQVDDLSIQCPEIPRENFILEPVPRGTASAIGLASVVLRRKSPDAVLAVLTADHYIRDEVHFRKLLSIAREIARENYLVTLGIPPSNPSTGYGYIQYGAALESRDGVKVFQVEGFREKPDQATAEKFLSSGGYAWNSGMFIMGVETYLTEVSRQMPALHQGLAEIERSTSFPDEDETRSTVWEGLRSQTIDYGIMEGAERVALIPAEGLGWNDVGSWDSLFDTMPPDENGNILLDSSSMALETTNTLLFDDAQERLIVTVGVEDLVVVDTTDVLLICRRGEGQKVRQIVEDLRRSGRNELL